MPAHPRRARSVQPNDSPDELEDAGEGSERPREFIQSLERGLAIIRVFNSERSALTISEISQLSGLGRAAVRRFILTLCDLGYVYANKNRFELTPQVLELGFSYLSALSFPDIALPRLERLVSETGEASEGSVLDRGQIVYVVRVPGPAMMTISVNVGARRPAYATAMGRVLLADLPDAELDAYLEHTELTRILPRTIVDPQKFRIELKKVRSQGYALVNQELEEGLVAIAVPVHDRRGRVRAAINLSTHVGRKSVVEMRALVPAVKLAAQDIEMGLRHSVSWAG